MWEMLSAAEIDLERVEAGPEDAWQATSPPGTERVSWVYDTAGEFPGWSWTTYAADGTDAVGWRVTGSDAGPDDERTRQALLDAVRAVAGRRQV